jgi:hypothetical protein
MDNKKTPKTPKNYYCECCDFLCYKDSDFNRHLLTAKHKRIKKDNDFTPKNANTKMQSFVCECGKSYSHQSGLCKHKKKCKSSPSNVGTIIQQPASLDPTLLISLIKDNQEFQKQMLEIIPKLQPNNTTNTNCHNTTNNQFNINMFLNEKCKDAMNLTDFLDSLPVTPNILNDTRENGLTKSLTNMMVDGLNTMDVYSRPIHCTDPKRKIMYVKDNDVWEKDEEQDKIKQGVTKLAVKQRANISNWQEDENDDWERDENMQIKFTNLVGQALQLSDQDPKEQNKIIKGICNATYLDSKIKEEYK